MSATAAKDVVVTARMSERQRETLRNLEEEDGLSTSDVLRRLVNHEGRRRRSARTWLMGDMAALVEKSSGMTLLAALLRRVAREAAERFEARAPLTVTRETSSRSEREESVRATVYFDDIKLPNNCVPRVALDVTRTEAGFEVRVGGDVRRGKRDDEPGLTIKFPLGAETPPELFPALFECALFSAANNGTTVGRT